MYECPIAIVLGADTNGLGAVRSLSRQRVPCVAVVGDTRQPLLYSRHPKRKIVAEYSHLLETMNEVGRLFPDSRPVIIPTSDQYVSFLAGNHNDLKGRFDVCMSNPELSETMIDKARETELIESLGIPLPATARDLSMDSDALIRRIGLPLIIKPRSHAHFKSLGRKNVVISTRPALDDFLQAHAENLSGLLAQELVEGDDECLWVCNGTFGRTHELVSAFTFQRLRLSPSHFGVTSYAISRRNEMVVECVARLGRALQFVGPVMVEFKFDRRDGEYKYIELNPRVGMCNYFDTVCGIPNVFNAYQVARNASPMMGQHQRDGVMYLSLWDDVYSRMKDGERVWKIMRDYLGNVRRPHVFALFDSGDPMPGLWCGGRQLCSLLAGMARRIWRGRRDNELAGGQNKYSRNRAWTRTRPHG